MISVDWIVYICVFVLFFAASFYALSCIDFSRFTIKNSTQKIYLLIFLLSLSLAWMVTEAVMTLTIRQGF